MPQWICDLKKVVAGALTYYLGKDTDVSGMFLGTCIALVVFLIVRLKK